MAKTFSCSTAGVPCGFKAKGNSEEEVLEQAVQHAWRVHGVDLNQSKTLKRFAQSAIRDDSGQPAEGR